MALVLLGFAVSTLSGCIHTWTGTYAEYPPNLYGNPHVPRQADPSDG
jgi:hypothetical protein